MNVPSNAALARAALPVLSYRRLPSPVHVWCISLPPPRPSCAPWRPDHARVRLYSSSNDGDKLNQGINDASTSTASSTSAFTTPSSTLPTTPSFPPPTFPASFGANQTFPLPPSISSRLSFIISHFNPPSSIRFSFAYGSGVFPQSQSGPEHSKRPESSRGKKMVDLVMAVSHLDQWHAVNMRQNPTHYSALARWAGPSFAARVTKMGAGLWYNPYIPMGEEMVKYGVMDLDTLCKDLLDWDTLYVSGRMHKPVGLISTDPRVRLAQQVNLASALRVSLLLLPREFTEVELYTRIASLSYTGDFRMSVPGGENADKVRNIVLGQRELFRRLYNGLIRSLGTVSVRERRRDRFVMEQDTSVSTRASHASKLPLNLRTKLQEHYTSLPSRHPSFLKLSLSRHATPLQRPPSFEKAAARSESLSARDVEDFWRAVVEQDDFEGTLIRLVGDIVKGPAWSQSLKGVWTAGVRRSLKYVAAKIGKYFDGRKARAAGKDGEQDGESEVEEKKR